jgi:hypothetical protein
VCDAEPVEGEVVLGWLGLRQQLYTQPPVRPTAAPLLTVQVLLGLAIGPIRQVNY